MPSHQVAVGVRACCVAVTLALTVAYGAEQKGSLVGATRQQVFQQLGEPRGIVRAGAREILTFERQRVILRDGVVVEVELVLPDPPRAAPTPSPTPAAPVAAEGAASASAPQPAPAQPPSGQPGSGQPAVPPVAPTATAAGQPPVVPSAAPAVAPPPPRNEFTIKSVRPPGSPPRDSTVSEATPQPEAAIRPAPAAPAVAPTPAPAAPVARSVAPPVSAPADTPVVTEATTPAPSAPVSVPGSPASESAALPPATTPRQDLATDPTDAPREARKAATDKPTQPEAAAIVAPKASEAPPRQPLAEQRTEGPSFFTRAWLIVLAVLGGGIAFLYWRRRQRQLELAATRVSRTPFAAAAGPAPTAGARFTPELLARLEWKRFEELVALYYSKTGVVAVRTKTGPSTPVHIKISWKGESRPFAYVQCISHPSGLVSAQPLQELVTALAADDIRRGYVVTAGKFAVDARDLAEEKHLTLLSGEIFLEKLNALPDVARSEIMQEITKGEYQTPSCPKCDAKMVRSPNDPSGWRCLQHPDVVVPATR